MAVVSMKKGLLIGIVVLWVGWVILVAIIEPGWVLPALLVGILLGAWIYFVRMVWKKGTSLFHEEMKPELAERRLKRLKTFLLVAGTSWAAINGGFVAYGLESQYGKGDAVSIVIPFFGIMVFIIATIGSLVIFLKGRQKPT